MRSFLLFLALALASQIETLLLAPRDDSAVWLYIAARQAHDEMPGRDLWDNKLPPIYQIGRLALWTGHPQAALWLLEGLLTAGGALAIKRLLQRLGERDGAKAAGVLLCLISGLPAQHAGGYMTEIYAMPLTAAAAWLTVVAAQQRSTGAGFAAGLCWALAASFRLPLAPVCATVPFLILLRQSAADGASATPATQVVGSPARRTLCGLLLGAASALPIVFFHPWLRGYLPDCLAAAVAWPLGLGGARVAGPLTPTTAERLTDFAQHLLKTGWLHAGAAAGFIMAYRARSRGGAAQGMRLAAMLVWYLGAVGTALAGWACYGHYLYVAWAPLVVGLGVLISRFPAHRRRALAAALLGVTSLTVAGLNIENFLRQGDNTDSDDRARTSEAVRRMASPTEGVFPWLRGRHAGLLGEMDRPAGNRHFLAESYFRVDLRLFDAFAEEFLAAPPAWIIEDLELRRPSLSMPGRFTWEASLPNLRRLQTFVSSRYRQVERMGQFVLWKYKG